MADVTLVARGMFYSDFTLGAMRVDEQVNVTRGNASTTVVLSVYQNFTSKMQWVYMPVTKTCTSHPFAQPAQPVCTNQIPGAKYISSVGMGDTQNNLWSVESGNGTAYFLLSPAKCYPMIVRVVPSNTDLSLGINEDIVNIVPSVDPSKFVLPAQCQNAVSLPAVAEFSEAHDLSLRAAMVAGRWV